MSKPWGAGRRPLLQQGPCAGPFSSMIRSFARTRDQFPTPCITFTRPERVHRRSSSACETRPAEGSRRVCARHGEASVQKGWVIMKRFALFATVAFVLLTPMVAGAQAPFVYRPELRAWIPIPPAAPTAVAPRTAEQHIARHEAMAQHHRGTRMAQAAEHCDRMVKDARAALLPNADSPVPEPPPSPGPAHRTGSSGCCAPQ
jgi:hypothetical protein